MISIMSHPLIIDSPMEKRMYILKQTKFVLIQISPRVVGWGKGVV